MDTFSKGAKASSLINIGRGRVRVRFNPNPNPDPNPNPNPNPNPRRAVLARLAPCTAALLGTAEPELRLARRRYGEIWGDIWEI